MHFKYVLGVTESFCSHKQYLFSFILNQQTGDNTDQIGGRYPTLGALPLAADFASQYSRENRRPN